MVALVLANSPLSASFLNFWKMPIGLQLGQLDFTRSLHHWINDGLMTLFFFVVSLELKREFRSEEHTSELQSLMRISYAVFCLKKKKQTTEHLPTNLKLHHKLT